MTVSYGHGASIGPLLGETIGENLARTARTYPDQDALVVPFQGIRMSYRAFDEEVDRVARGLLGLGVEKGERVGIWSPNNAEWVVLQYATAKVGAILVNLNPAYRTHEVAYALQQSGCRFLVAATEFKSSSYVDMIAEVRPELPLLERVDDSALAERMAMLAFDDPINIQYTSGTTGFPKGATLSHHNILNNLSLIHI